MGPIVEYAQLYKNQKDVWIFIKMYPTGRAKNIFHLVYFFTVIHHNIQKAQRLVDAQACQEIIVFPN